jgi:hypothetical protein
MKDAYDFSKADRGKFFRTEAAPKIPLYLKPEVRRLLNERSQRQGRRGQRLGQRFIERNIEMIEATSSRSPQSKPA